MRWRFLASVATASYFLPIVFGAVRTVSIALSYCPAPPVSQTSGAVTTSPSVVSGPPFFLYVAPEASRKLQARESAPGGGSVEYVASGSTLTTDITQAQTYTLTNGGHLMSGGLYFSTSGLVPSEPFEPRASIAAISILFSNLDGDLIWVSDSFANQRALFCYDGSILEILFDGNLISGCNLVNLGILAVSDVSMPTGSTSTSTSVPTMSSSGVGAASSTSTTPTAKPYALGSVHNLYETANPIGCLKSTADSPALNGVNETITTTDNTLESCLHFCGGIWTYFSVQNGNVCVCANSIATSASPANFGSCNTPCASNSSESCGGSTAAAVYIFVNGGGESAGTSSSSTSPSHTSTTSSGSSTASSITSSTSRGGGLTPTTSTEESAAPSTTTAESTSLYPSPTSSGVPNCSERSPFDGTVNGGYLILCDTDLPGFDIFNEDGSSLSDCISKCSAYAPPQFDERCVAVEFDMTATSSQCYFKSGIGTISRGGNAGAQAAIVVNQPYSPTISFTGETSPISSSSTSSVPSSSSTGSSSTTSSSTSSSSSSSLAAGPTPPPQNSMTQPPSSVAPPPMSSGQTPPFTTSSAIALIQPPPPSTTAVSPPPTTPNQALPTTSSSPAGAQPPPSTLTTPVANPPTTPASMTTAAAPPPATSATTSSRLTTATPALASAAASTTAAPVTSSANAAPVCTVTPPATFTLCPTFNHDSVSIGLSCYEIECSTTLQGVTISPANTTTSLNTCIGQCNLYNLALPFGCVGVNYYNSLSINNCVFLSSISNTAYTLGVDSGRLEYAGYPSITDPYYTASSMTMAVATTQTTISSTSNRPSLTTPAPTTTPATTTTSSSAYSGSGCPPAQTMATICPGTSGQCFSYNTYGTTENYEIECSTKFSGAALQPYVAFSQQDCIGFCQYDNINKAATCVGATFLEGPLANPVLNNCFPYSSITGITRGNASYNSGRLLYSGYQTVSDYGSATPGP